MVFFTIRVTEEIAKDGLALRCMSPNKSRFKLIVSVTIAINLSLLFGVRMPGVGGEGEQGG